MHKITATSNITSEQLANVMGYNYDVRELDSFGHPDIDIVTMACSQCKQGGVSR